VTRGGGGDKRKRGSRGEKDSRPKVRASKKGKGYGEPGSLQGRKPWGGGNAGKRNLGKSRTAPSKTKQGRLSLETEFSGKRNESQRGRSVGRRKEEAP